ncbi:class I fructose-bisphosphate aldolase [Pseudonocardia asaccharolytica]|uniref:fructose-bisphosphate aldolase n=1 Tax=Pseudonocardia asaccharolytica DSM 44247 = NBRC 16224 TaxID=1123024 RepID=A0A511D6V3_9PSEU|nr:class I fructose-bisphosphate aldolase [Pseudonocardia asaccharolytica]GEL20519.1 fructose-bisphosphate aldolase [Pseudonocardia asaccharolytica DSM 44247 = NBRC 16224]
MTALRSLAGCLTAPGRGLLAVDQPSVHLHDMLRRARLTSTEQNCRALRDLVLATPGLHRMLSGVLLDPEELSATAHPVGPLPSLLAARRVPIGVRMGDETTEVIGSADRITEEVDRHAENGAMFARWRQVIDGSDRSVADEAQVRIRAVATWAAICQRGGLVPVVECVVRVADQDTIEQVEVVHTRTVGAVMSALDAAKVDLAATVLGANLVLPGRRAGQTAASEDVAMASVRSLREAGAGSVAGIVFTPSGQPRHLAAHLAAMQWCQPGWPISFCQGRSLLAPTAAVWRGRPDRVAPAQNELRSRLGTTLAVLRAGRSEVTRRDGQAWWDGYIQAGSPLTN